MAKKSKKLALPVAMEAEPVNRTSKIENKEYEERERKYRAKDAIDTMKRAEDIKKDKQLMSDVKRYAKEEVTALKKLC